MPYIKKEERPQYDEIIRDLIFNLGENREGVDFVKQKLINLLSSQDLKSIDGHFNYFITKTVKDLGWINGKSGTFFGTVGSPQYVELKDFILDVIKQVYPPKYFNYNRAIGMLTCCSKEFSRRYKKKAVSAQMLLESLSNQLYDEDVGPYEDTKIIENGDV